MLVRRGVPLFALAFLTACGAGGDSLGPAGDEGPAFDVESDGSAAPVRRYRVTIENLTGGQPFSPGVVVTHRPSVQLFTTGEPASPGVQAIAEDGDPAIAAASLPGTRGVSGVVATAAPVFQLGGPGPSSLTLEIDGAPWANRLSLALMLICTNDGFVGLRSVALPADGRSRVYYAPAYDSGTEENDEASPSIVDPCFAIGPVPGPADGNARPASRGLVHGHPGIAGGADLSPAAHGWTEPVARVTIQRIE